MRPSPSMWSTWPLRASWRWLQIAGKAAAAVDDELSHQQRERRLVTDSKAEATSRAGLEKLIRSSGETSTDAATGVLAVGRTQTRQPNPMLTASPRLAGTDFQATLRGHIVFGAPDEGS